MTLSLEEAVKALISDIDGRSGMDLPIGDEEVMEEMRVSWSSILKAYARHCAEKARPKDGISDEARDKLFGRNSAIATYHAALIQYIGK